MRAGHARDGGSEDRSRSARIERLMRQINNLIRRIDLTSLQLFVAVCEEGTLTRAASRENIALSAVSKRLVELEEALGTDLFVRHSKGMMLAPAGESLLHHAVDADERREDGSGTREYRMGIRGHIRMLANVSAIVEFLPTTCRLSSRPTIWSRSISRKD
jgi:DNA-binding transcriptional LysR family regulator